MELSRRALSYLSVAGFVLAGAGWMVAWQNAGKADNAMMEATAAKKRHTKVSSREITAAVVGKLSSDPRTARLLAGLDELNEGAESGKPNPKYLKAVQSVLDDSLYHRRQRNFRIILEKMRPEDAVALHERFREMEKGGRYFPEYDAFAARWGEVDGKGAMDYFSAGGLPVIMESHWADILTGWGAGDPEKALAWIESNKDEIGGKNAYRPLLIGWIGTDPVAATAWLSQQKFSPREVAECVTSGALDKIYSDGLEGACAWIAGLPDDNPDMMAAARSGWTTHVMRQQRLDPALAATSWTAVANEPWMQASDFNNFCTSVSGSEPEALQTFVDQISKQWKPAQANAQFVRWAGEDPENTALLLARMPACPLREAAREAFLGAVTQSNPDQAATWRGSFTE